MTPSPAYVLGALDTLVKAGEVSPAYAAGVVDVLAKEAGWLFDTEAENLTQQWGDYMQQNPNAYDFATGRATIGAGQAKQMIDSARPWYDNMWGRMGANIAHGWRRAKSWMPEAMVGKSMSAEESRRLLELDRNRFRQDYLNRAQGAAPAALYGAFQDEATRDARYAYRDQQNYMSPDELAARFRAEDEDDAAAQFRTPEGTAAMRNGLYKPTHDKQSAKPPAPSINNNPLAHMYGNKDRNKLFTRSFRNGLGMY